ncbi:hypothetical protein M0804_013273 [Polistes exclamans]|nr:hypothetical protein M0804_013273 [Polistes exclamans]
MVTSPRYVTTPISKKRPREDDDDHPRAETVFPTANSEWVRRPKDKANLFAKHLANVFKPSPFTSLIEEEDTRNFLNALYQMSQQIKPFTTMEIKLTITTNVNLKKDPGYELDIIIYCGSNTIVAIEYQYIGKPGNIVMQHILNKGYIVYLDNWYSNPTLFNLLHENVTNACGSTVQRRRNEMSNCKITDKLNKKYLKSQEKDVLILKPKCVIDYNYLIDTIDKFDMFINHKQTILNGEISLTVVQGNITKIP